MEISEVRAGLIPGTITAGGTLTSELDLGGWSTAGLISDGSALTGTLTFQVSAYSDNDTRFSSNYVELRNGDGTALSITIAANRAISGDEIIQALASYRYVKIKTSAAQTNGAKFYLPVKA